jgi:hypothetical protein
MVSRRGALCACAAALVLVPRAALGFRAPGRVIPTDRLRVGASRWRMLSGGSTSSPGGASGGDSPASAGQPLPLAARLAKLRSLMAEEGLDALIVPSDDPHLSEYPPECFNRREFVSGFTGSTGTAVVTRNEALLW